ncbi:MAG: MCE family protein [Ignavibacteriae bacterium]|nr:MCE family protein [Ignavibacteria bacterium]MBI3364576.1 MCE family protein [Ignavibacteriota bacterium]
MNQTQMKWSSLKVGLVVLVGLVVFVFIVSIVGTEQNVFASTYQLKFFLTNVHGLVNGAMISLGGLKVGYVRDMRFATRDSVNGVDITADLLTKYRSTITTSTFAQIKTIGLLGDKYIDLTIGSRDEPPLVENSYIPIIESFDIEMAGPQFRTALADFTELLKSAKHIAATMDRGEGSIGRLIKQPTIANEMERFLRSLNGLMAAVEEKRGALGKFIYDESFGRNISDVSSNLKNVTDQIRQGKGTMGKLIMDDRLYTSLSSFSARADSLMAKASADTSSVSKLVSDGNFYRQLIGMMKDLNLLLVDLREHPERYVKISVF